MPITGTNAISQRYIVSTISLLEGELHVRNRGAGRTGCSSAHSSGRGDGALSASPRTGRHCPCRLHRRARGRRDELLRIVNPSGQIGPYLDAASGLLVTFNGEIYNFRQIASTWGIDLHPDDTDAHLVLRAWAKLGPACLDGLDGMFALAVYDPRETTLFLARDRLAQKPLYWRLDGGRLAFASEVSTLVGYGDAPIVVRPEMLAIETPIGVDTPYQGIQLLAPATVLAFDVASGSLDQRTWWSLDRAEPFTEDYGRALAQVSGLLAEQVPLRAPAGDFALLLSGGLDSSLLAYLMRPQLCVTVRYPGQDRLDESAQAAAVARDIGAELLVIEPGPEDFKATLPSIMSALDYPMGNASTFSEYMAYAAIAERGVRVVIGGLGPDEFLMGYIRHALALFGPEEVLAAGLTAYRPLAGKLLHSDGGRWSRPRRSPG